jgi:hypothetical protein
VKPKHSAAKLFSPTNTSERNLGIALFGDVVWTEQQATIIYLVGLFEKVGSYDEVRQKVSQPFCEREFDRIARPLLVEALLKQDAKPFKEIAAAVEAAKRIKKEGPVHKLETEIMRLEDERLTNYKPVVVHKTKRGRLIRLDKTDLPPLDNTELNKKLSRRLLDCPDREQVRRAAKRLGVPLKTGKTGRPKKSDK